MAQWVKRLLSKGKDLSSTLHSLHRAVHSVVLSFKLLQKRWKSPQKFVFHKNKITASTVGDEKRHSRMTTDLHTSAAGMHTIYTHKKKKRKGGKEGKCLRI